MDYFDLLKHIDPEYGCKTAKKLSLIGNDGSGMGFKNAGSSGERKAAAYIIEEMKSIGLKKISVNSFPVDSWEFRGSILIYKKDGKRISYPLSAFAGTKGVCDGKIIAPVVDVGYGKYEECGNKELNGKIAFVRIDLNKEYWVGVTAYQLELMGAVAVIAMLEGDCFGDDEEALNSADVIGRANIPVLNISRINGKHLETELKKTEIEAFLITDIIFAPGESGNIVGEIPGTGKEKSILLGAHYDSFFRAYIDDAFGVGAVLAMAKAIIECGYRPRYNIKVIFHGAEEFGVSDSHCDWCIGSWQQINNISPEWSDEIALFLNIDAPSPDAEELLVQASPCMHTFFDESLAEISDVIESRWGKGYSIADVNGPWSDDFSYYMEGIPVAILGRGASQWRKKVYHTDKDEDSDLREDIMRGLIKIYLKLIFDFDNCEKNTMDFQKELECFYKSIDWNVLNENSIETSCFESCYEKFRLGIEKLIRLQPNKVQSIYKECPSHIRALDFEDSIIYKTEEVQKNLKLIKRIEEYIVESKYENAVDILMEFSGSSIMKDFQEDVYQYWCVKVLDESYDRLQWGRDLIEKPLDIRALYYAIGSKNNIDNILGEIEVLKKAEVEKGRRYIENIVQYLEKIINTVEEKQEKCEQV